MLPCLQAPVPPFLVRPPSLSPLCPDLSRGPPHRMLSARAGARASARTAQGDQQATQR